MSFWLTSSGRMNAKIKECGSSQAIWSSPCILSEICYFLHNEVCWFSAGQCFPYSHKELESQPWELCQQNEQHRTAASGCSLNIALRHWDFLLFFSYRKKKIVWHMAFMLKTAKTYDAETSKGVEKIIASGSSLFSFDQDSAGRIL